MSDYIDKLTPEEKPNTFGSWRKVMKKCGYGVSEEYVEQTDEAEPCNFSGNYTTDLNHPSLNSLALAKRFLITRESCSCAKSPV